HMSEVLSNVVRWGTVSAIAVLPRLPIYLISYGFFFFLVPTTSAIYTLSLHDALPISRETSSSRRSKTRPRSSATLQKMGFAPGRSEEHTSELQSLAYLVCRLLLEKKKPRR